MPEPFDGDKLDPESLAKKLAEQLRSSAPKRKRRRPFPTAGVLRGTGIAAIALGIGFGALAALPWVGVALGMTLNSWHSDKTQERYRHLGIALAMGMIALPAILVVLQPA